MTGFAEKYGANAFDPDDANDACADRARRAVISAYISTLSNNDGNAPRETEMVFAGLLVGVVDVMRAITPDSMDRDAAIRASFQQAAPWAVDMSRAQSGLDPLSDRN